MKINNIYGEYAWLCADTGVDVVKAGVTISGKGRSLTYKDGKGKKHKIELTNLKTKEILNPLTNRHEKSNRSKIN